MPAPKPWLSRSETARMCGRTISWVYKMHGNKLHPVRDAAGTWKYSRDEVERIAAILRVKTTRGAGRKKLARGELACIVFGAFDLGMSLSDIVQTYKVEPELVRAWHQDYVHGYESPKPLTPEAAAKLDLERGKLRYKNQKLALVEEKHLTVQRRRRDPHVFDEDL